MGRGPQKFRSQREAEIRGGKEKIREKKESEKGDKNIQKKNKEKVSTIQKQSKVETKKKE